MRSKRIAGSAAGLLAAAVALSLGVAPAADAAPAPDIKVTQNYSDAIVAGDGISCNGGGIVADNQYYRRFDMSVYGAQNGFKVSKMTVAVEEATSSAGGVPGDFNIYAIDHTADLTIANLGTPVGTTPVDLESASGSELKSAAISATIPAGKDMVIELSVDDAGAGDASFYPGANEAPELGTTYLSSTSCGITEPTELAAVGPFAGIANIMFVNGKTTDCMTAETAATTAATTAAAAATKATAATADKAAADKKVTKAKKKLKKAKKSGVASKIKKAKAKLKKAKKAAKAANAAYAAAQAAKAAADAALTAANAAQATKCAQPALPPAPAAPAGGQATKPASKGGFSLSSAR
ncbi:hypothetical protein [Nocardioides halotolerans]|jgi:hypothetical protein|uniref:hypothetical protein n=1 Tax=Nocardioides halotolerans TaxID=433660 RepID=UPI0012FB7004|nr:hypothetical protein [Nocardioides halotolerans]